MALLMLLSTLIACAKPQGDDPAESATISQADTEADTDFFPAIEKKDYEDATFTMIGFNDVGSWYYAESLNDSDESNSVHVLNNTIYEMNLLVEDYLGVKLAYEEVTQEVTGGEIWDTVQPTIMSGDDTYQLCILHPYYSYNSFILGNGATDLYTLDSLDLDQPYWNRDVIKSLEVNGHAYIGLGDICEYSINMLYCNKDLFTEAQRTLPYDSVRNGTWTLDEMLALTTGLYVDKDGNGRRNNKDTYGFATCWDANGTAFMQGSGISVLSRNEEDEFVLSMYGDRLINMYEKIYTWTNDESSFIWSFADRENTNILIDFMDNQTYMTLEMLGTTYLEAEFEVGMLPIPKYDTAQANYAHINWGNNIIVPSSVQNKDMVGDVLELMSYYSRTVVRETYYDDVLQLRVSEAPDDREMVVLIFNTIVYDPGIAFCDGNHCLWNLVYLPCFGIREGKSNIASYYRENASSAERTLQNMFRRLK